MQANCEDRDCINVSSSIVGDFNLILQCDLVTRRRRWTKEDTGKVELKKGKKKIGEEICLHVRLNVFGTMRSNGRNSTVVAKWRAKHQHDLSACTFLIFLE